MKKLICTMFLSCFPLIGLASDNSLMSTEISIKPLEIGFGAKSGVLGTEVQFELNGKSVVQDLIYITGDVAEELVRDANKGIKESGKIAHYSFQKTTEMIVLSGHLAQKIISESTKYSLNSINNGTELAINSSKTVFYETLMITALAKVYTKSALEMAANVGASALRTLYGEVKFISGKVNDEAQKLYWLTVSKIKQSIEFSKNLVFDGVDTTLVLANSSLVFISDSGAYIYDYTSKNVFKIASLSFDGALIMSKTITKLSLNTTTLVGGLIVNAFDYLSQISVSVEFQ